jgi:hypothetical protein
MVPVWNDPKRARKNTLAKSDCKNYLVKIFGFSVLAEDEEIPRTLDKHMYLLYRDLKRIGIVSHKCEVEDNLDPRLVEAR